MLESANHWFEATYERTRLGLVECTKTLVRKFRSSEIKAHPNKKDKDGNALSYLDTASCIDRLNEAFPLGWSFHCNEPFFPPLPADKPQIVPHSVAVLGIMTVHMPWGDITRSQFGSSVLKSIYEGGQVKAFGTEKAYQQQYAEYGDDLKSAASDALKKCATLFGIGTYISRKGKTETAQDAINTLFELLDVAGDKKMTKEQMLEFCGGVTGKTVNSADDLSLTQAQVCLALLKDTPALELSPVVETK